MWECLGGRDKIPQIRRGGAFVVYCILDTCIIDRLWFKVTLLFIGFGFFVVGKY